MARPPIEISFEPDPDLVRKVEEQLADMPKAANRILLRGINVGARKAFTIAKRAISKELGIKQSDLTTPHRLGSGNSGKKGSHSQAPISVKRATLENLVATVRISSGRIPLAYFKPRELPGVMVQFRSPDTGRAWLNKTRGGGVRYRMGSLGTRTAKSAFLGRARKGSAESASVSASSERKRVFVRTSRLGARKAQGRKRDPFLRELLGPSVPYVARKNKALRDGLRIDMAPAVNAEIARQFELWKLKNAVVGVDEQGGE